MELLEMIADERRRLADLVEVLTGEQLRTRSLCAQWSVKEVVGHLVAVVAAPRSALLKLLVSSGFRVHEANARLAVQMARRPARELAAMLREHAGDPFRPPVVGYPGALTDLLVHGEDVRRPLGLPADLRPERVRVALDFLTGGRAVGFTPRRRLAGLRLEATDSGWVSGAGLAVRGKGEVLMLALCGRAVALDELDGAGVDTLRVRLPG